MNFLFVHSWNGFSLAEWYLREALKALCQTEVRFSSADVPGDEIPSNDILARKFFLTNPDVVGFSCYYWNIDHFIAASKWIKKVRPATRIIFGGPQVRSEKFAGHLLKNHPSIDYIIRGPGEQALSMLINGAGDAPEQIPHLSYRRDGSVRHNPENHKFHTRNLIFHKNNAELHARLSLLQEVSYETVQGCYHDCAYCYYPLDRYKLTDDELVFAELAYLCSTGISHLRICDTHFGGNAGRAKKILSYLADNNKQSTIRIYPDLQHIDEEYLGLMKQAHASITSIGIQSTHEASLTKIHRKPNHLDQGKIRLILKEFPEVPADVIIGLPGDSPQSLEKTFRDILGLGFSNINIFRLRFFPGTAIYENRDEYFGKEEIIESASGQYISSDDRTSEQQERISAACAAAEITADIRKDPTLSEKKHIDWASVYDRILELDNTLLNQMSEMQESGRKDDLVKRLRLENII